MGLTEIIISLVDQASAGMEGIANTAESSFSRVETASSSAATSMTEMENSANSAGTALDSVDPATLDTVSNSAETASTSLDQAGNAANGAAADITEVGNASEDAANKASEIGAATQDAANSTAMNMAAATVAIGATAGGLELAAQKSNTLNASFAKMATVNLPEDQLRDMVTAMTDVNFPTEDALLYIKTLKQIGVTATDSLDTGAQAFNTIQVATGVSSEEVVKFSNSMVAMGMDMNNIPSSFNAIAYANANMVGGFGTYINWMQKYDSTFKAMGLNIDQTAVLISAATKKFGGGRAAYTGLNDAIKASNGDLSQLEQQLGMQPGALANASEATAAYSGKLDKNAKISNEHTTILQKAKAYLDDLTVKYGDTIGVVGSFGGILGATTGVITAAATAKLALAGATGTETAAENASTLSKIRGAAASAVSRGADMLSAASTAIRTAALTSSTGITTVALGAAAAHTTGISANTAATNLGAVAYIRAATQLALQTGATIAGTAATYAAQAAQWLWNAALSANPIGIIIIAIVAFVAILAILYNKNETVRNAINWLWDGLKNLGGYIMGGLMAAWNALTSALEPITNALGRLWSAITQVFGAFMAGKSSDAGNFFNQVAGAAQWLWGILSQVAGIVMTGLTPLFQLLGQILTALAGIITGAFGAAWTTVSGIIGAVIGFLARFINIIADLISGNISFSQAMTQIWNSLKIMLVGILLSIMTGIGQFGISLVQKGLAAARSFVTNIIIWISQLPMRIWVYLLVMIARVLAWRTLIIAYARQAGSQMVSNFISFIQSLPGRAWTFLMYVIQRLGAFVNQSRAKASEAGSQIISAISSYLSSLPGRMYEWGVSAITSFANAIIDAIPGLRSALDMVSSLFPHSPPKEGPLATIKESNMYKWAKNIGDQMKKGVDEGSQDMFSNVQVPTDVPTTSPASPATMPTQTVPSAGVDLDVPGLQTQTTTAQGIIASSVGIVTAQYAKLKSNTGLSLTGMVNNQKLSFTNMKTNMATTLDSIVAHNKQGYANIQKTTLSVLTGLKSKTKEDMSNVKASWDGMRDGLVAAAEKIKNNVGGDINNLSSNIGTFYGKIRNPAQFLAGPPTGFAGGKVPRGMYAGRPDRASSRSNINLLDKIPTIPCLDPPCYAGGWEDFRPNASDVMGNVNSYTPTFPPYGSFNKDVGDFTNSTNPLIGDFSAYKTIAEHMIGATAYQFYYNSKGGSPYSIYESGQFNCWDGALIMLQLADAFGLSGYMAHGMWGPFGHVWAVIEGMNMDTTAYQGGYGWTSPKVTGYAGSPPSFKDYGQMVSESTYQEIILKEILDLNLNVKLDGADDLDEDSLLKVLKTIINDSALVKAIAKNATFRDTLKVELARGNSQTKRVYGA